MPTSTQPTPARAALQALAAIDATFSEAYLRAWFTETLGGEVAMIPGGFRLSALGVDFPAPGTFIDALAAWAKFITAAHATAPVADFLALLDGRDLFVHLSMIEAAVIATGGTWVRPPAGDEWAASHIYEISLFHILGRGTSALDAARDWIASARRLTQEVAA